VTGSIVLLNTSIIFTVDPRFLFRPELGSKPTAKEDPITPSWVFELIISCLFSVDLIGGKKVDVSLVVFDEFRLL
jgi:hypothetical protein